METLLGREETNPTCIFIINQNATNANRGNEKERAALGFPMPRI